MSMYQRILIATDGSELSKKAVASAIELASLTGAELIALKVIPRYPVGYFEGNLAVPVQEISRIEKDWADQGQEIADAVKASAQAQGVKARAVTVKGDLVAEAIMAATRKYKCDLVVMASHGRKGLKRILLGSETQHVLTHSTVPVLVLR